MDDDKNNKEILHELLKYTGVGFKYSLNTDQEENYVSFTFNIEQSFGKNDRIDMTLRYSKSGRMEEDTKWTEKYIINDYWYIEYHIYLGPFI